MSDYAIPMSQDFGPVQIQDLINSGWNSVEWPVDGDMTKRLAAREPEISIKPVLAYGGKIGPNTDVLLMLQIQNAYNSINVIGIG